MYWTKIMTPLSSSDSNSTVLSHLGAEHCNGHWGIFSFFDRNTARNFSLVNKECYIEIKKYRNSLYKQNPWPVMAQYQVTTSWSNLPYPPEVVISLADGQTFNAVHQNVKFGHEENTYYMCIRIPMFLSPGNMKKIIISDFLEWTIIKNRHRTVSRQIKEQMEIQRQQYLRGEISKSFEERKKYQASITKIKKFDTKIKFFKRGYIQERFPESLRFF